jgi:hypothetical protein
MVLVKREDTGILKEVLNRNQCGTRFGKGYGPVVKTDCGINAVLIGFILSVRSKGNKDNI